MSNQSRSVSGFAKLLFCLSGFAALAYQLMSFKMISAAGMGDGLSVAISLTSFVALAGLGAVIGPKKLKVASAEMLMGVWAVGSFGLVQWPEFSLFVNLFSDGSMVQKLLTFLGLTAPIAFLSGALVPLYEKHIGEEEGSPKGGVFILIYLLFHTGGAAGLILLETVLSPLVGWPMAGILFGCVSIFIGLLSTRLPRAQLSPGIETNTMSKGKVALLFLVSILTGIMGVAVYKAFDYMVGPNIRNYASVTACIFVGLGLSALIAKHVRIPFFSMISISATSVLIFMTMAIYGAEAGVHLIGSGFDPWVVYAMLAICVIIPAYALAGLSIPVAVQDGLPGRWALLVVSLGNAVGYWVYIGTAPMMNDLLIMLLMASLFIFGTQAFKIYRGEPTTNKEMIGAVLMALAILTLPAKDFSTHLSILESRLLAAEVVINGAEAENLRFETLESWNSWGWPSEVVRVSVSEQTKNDWNYPIDSLVINGFGSLMVSRDSDVIYSESAASLISALYAENNTRSLVIGAGTGVSASAVSRFFDRVDLVDLNADTPAMLEYFSDLNGLPKDNVTFLQKDAMSHIASGSAPEYDLIFSTVTGAGYSFSAMLYTEEFFELTKKKLQPKGVFAFWIDNRLSMGDGVSRIISAADKVFDHLAVVEIYQDSRPSKQYVPYSVVIGSDSPLGRGHQNHDQIQEALRQSFGKTEMGEYVNLSDAYPREIRLCVRKDAEPASLKKLAFAYDYKTEIESVQERIRFTKETNEEEDLCKQE